jgi:acetyl-CoA carboxylase biotin carboxylase subunit
MNTRIQVEHPVTELVTNTDLIAEQIRVASGEKLSMKQSDITLTGHAIECRINAEDPNTFLPSPGKIEAFHAPGGPGVRIDTHVYSGYSVPPYYDSLLAKLITYDKTRELAIEKMYQALSETVVQGVKTNIDLHKKLLRTDFFASGKYSINTLTKYIKNN